MQTRDRHQVARAAARQHSPLLGAQRVLQPDREPDDDPRRRPFAEQLSNRIRELCAQPQDRTAPRVAGDRFESSTCSNVSGRADTLAQQARGQVVTTRICKAPRAPQPDFERPALRRVWYLLQVVPRELDSLRQLELRLPIDCELEADTIATTLWHRVDCTTDRER